MLMVVLFLSDLVVDVVVGDFTPDGDAIVALLVVLLASLLFVLM